MEIHLDANATTAVLPAARTAALHAMAEDFGNASSSHSGGLRARRLVDDARDAAARVLHVAPETLTFTSGATEAIQTAVVSALVHLRETLGASTALPALLVGSTEHKAVIEAVTHWNAVLRLGLPIGRIPVGADGRHDLPWLRRHAADAGLVCTMAVNNETGVISDLDGIGAALADSPALWLVDAVQALGKHPLDLARRRIDFASFSGHKLYAPKGVGLLYARDPRSLQPLMIGGGQEGGRRSGTENVPGIAAFGAVLRALDAGATFASAEAMQHHRARLVDAWMAAFPSTVILAATALCVPTTISLAVPGTSSGDLLNLFDAAGVRLSGGSACSAAAARPSEVLLAMGHPDSLAANAIRLSFGPADDLPFVEEACRRIRTCGAAWASWATGSPSAPAASAAQIDPSGEPTPWLAAEVLSRWLDEGRDVLVVDVREPFEQAAGPASARLGIDAARACVEAAPLSRLAEDLPRWSDRREPRELVFICRSGPRSERAARLVRSVRERPVWCVAGGLALWDGAELSRRDAVTRPCLPGEPDAMPRLR